MQVETIKMTATKADQLYRQYRDHRHYSTAVDEEIKKACRAISQGKMVIQALESIKKGGLNARGLPNLAIGRADSDRVAFEASQDGRGAFSTGRAINHGWGHRSSQRFEFPKGTFPVSNTIYSKRAWMPEIPRHIKPKQAIAEYHVLFEAEWEPEPVKDPYLMRRIGNGDLWIVVAAWDLSPIEVAAMSTRVMFQ